MKKSTFITFLVLIILCGGILRYLLASNFGYESDIRESYRVFAAKVVIQGPFELYLPDANWDVDYPPLLPWLFGAMAKIGGGLGAGEFPLFKRELAILLALGDMGLIILLATLAGARSRGVALTVAATWAFNPASLFDTGYWAQPNPFHLFFACLSIWLILKRRWFWGGFTIAVACLIKPQVWPLLPALALWIWRDGRFKALLRGFYGWALPIVIIWLAFLGAGRAPTLRFLFINSVADHLSLSVGAHSIWWLAVVVRQGMISSTELWLEGISSGQIAWFMAAVVLGVFLLLWWKLKRNQKGVDGVEMMALWAWLFFLMAPQQHENHAMLALSLATTSWALGRKIGWVVICLSVLIPMNCFLHDERMLRAVFSQPTEGMTALFLSSGNYTNNMSPATALIALASLAVGVIWWVRSFGNRKAAQA